MTITNALKTSVNCLTEGDFKGAAALADAALSIAPHVLPLHEVRVQAAAQLYDSDYLITSLKDWCKAYPWIAEPCFMLSAEYIIRGQSAAAAEWMDLGLSRAEAADETRKLPYGQVTFARLYHDEAQIRYLVSNGILANDVYLPIADIYRAISQTYFKPIGQGDQIVSLTKEELLNISPFYRRCLHIYNESVADHVLNENLNFEALVDQYAHCGYVVIDDVLKNEAMMELSNYLLKSTIWHNDDQKGKSYLGAYQDTGGKSRTLQALSIELQVKFSRIMASRALSQVWSYRNVYGVSAIGIHADFADINFNLWVTPDDFCVSPSEGMQIFDKRAPTSWKFERYNSDDNSISEFLEGAKKDAIGYKRNRAVLFDSSLFHGSGYSEFRGGYEGMRTNVTLLFGER